MGKSVVELARGRISSEEFVPNVTKDGTMMAVSMTGSNLGAIIGTAEAICLKLRQQHERYQLEMHAAFDVFYMETSQALKQGFDLVAAASADDGRSIQDGLACIAGAMNKQLAFQSRESFSHHLRSGNALAF